MATTFARKKESINATVSPSIKKRVLELVDSGEYSSMSDVVVQALNKLFADIDTGYKTCNREIKHKDKEFEMFERDIWKQKGMTYQKMGKLEEAIKCYDKALGIDSTEDNEKTRTKIKTVKNVDEDGEEYDELIFR